MVNAPAYPDPFANTNFSKSKKDFHWVDTEEIHAARRKEILKAHPEIKELFGPEPRTLPLVVLIFSIQMFMVWWVRDKSWATFLIAGYVVGGTLNHSMQLASHELSHNLCFKKSYLNKLLAIFTNLPTGVPSAILFQRYHMEHHQYQGVDGIDTDIPTLAEVRIFRTTLFKLFWMFLQPAFYALRPVYVKPKTPSFWEFVNTAACLAFDVLIYTTFGPAGLGYMIFGTLIGLGVHPCAGHFVAEHYEFVHNQETYSYYGSCNFFNFNVGYHNEHHDFPKVPWSKLATVKAIAPEYYDHLPQYTSYIQVIYHYIMDPEMGPFSRVKRKSTKGRAYVVKKGAVKKGQ